MVEKREKRSIFSPRKKARVGKVYLSQRQIYLLPRKQGLGFFLFILLLLLLATNFQNPLIHFLLFWLMGLALVSLFSTWRNLYGLTIRVETPDNIFTGEMAQWTLKIENTTSFLTKKGHSFGKKRIRERPRSLKVGFYRGRQKESTAEPFSSALLPARNKGGGQWVVHLNSQGVRRGYNKVPPIKIESHAPFGFFKAWAYLWLEGEVLAYPQPIPSGIPPHTTIEEMVEKEEEHATFEGNDDFDELVAYERGHSLRRINWRAYAKGQGLFTMRFKNYAGESAWYNLDDYSGGEELARAKLCYHLLKAEEKGEVYGLKLAGKLYPPNQGREHLTRLLTALALE